VALKIYTKTGDDGSTGLFGGGRVPKDALRIESYGTVDELNSVLGVAACYVKDKKISEVIHYLQNDLFNLGADLATPYDVKNDYIGRVSSKDVDVLEKWIDQLDIDLPELTNFILPGGSPAASYLHLARNVCRRAERLTVSLSREENIGPTILTYLNRLSDLLFVLARYANKVEKSDEVKWTRK